MPVIQATLIAKHLSGVYSTLFDSILFTLIISPVLYFLVFKIISSEEHLLCMPRTELMPGQNRIKELNEGLAAIEMDIDEIDPIYVAAAHWRTG